MGTIVVDDELSSCPFYVPRLTVVALVPGGPYGAEGAMYRWVAPDSTMPVSCCGRICPCGASGVGIYIRVGLQLKLGSYNKYSLRGYLCTTVYAVPQRHLLSLHDIPFSLISF